MTGDTVPLVSSTAPGVHGAGNAYLCSTSIADLYDRSMTLQSAHASRSSSRHHLRIERSSAHHAAVMSAPYAGDVWLSGGTAESLPDTIEHGRRETGETRDGEHIAS